MDSVGQPEEGRGAKRRADSRGLDTGAHLTTGPRNIRLLIEYDGTAYCGWQVQREARTVSGEVLSAIERITGERVDLVASSRTDAGVHARGQVANFITSVRMPAEKFLPALNSTLPLDIVIKDSREALMGFDSRRHALSKSYCYIVLNRSFPSALSRRYSWFVPHRLDVHAMEEAAAHLTGEHDFSSFMAADSDARTTIRRIFSFRVERKGDFVELWVRGNAFLRHMVRIMAGTLVGVGKGKLRPADVKDILLARDRARALATAPPEGLVLVAVEYGEG